MWHSRQKVRGQYLRLNKPPFAFKEILRLNGHRLSVTDPIPANVYGLYELQDIMWVNLDGTCGVHYPSCKGSIAIRLKRCAVGI